MKSKKVTTKKKDVLKAKKAKKSVRIKTLLGDIQTVNPHKIGLSFKGKKRKKNKGVAEASYRGVNASSASYNRKKKE